LQYGMIFDQKRADDLESSYFGVSVLVDAFSADYLRGSVVASDWSRIAPSEHAHPPEYASPIFMGGLKRPGGRV